MRNKCDCCTIYGPKPLEFPKLPEIKLTEEEKEALKESIKRSTVLVGEGRMSKQGQKWLIRLNGNLVLSEAEVLEEKHNTVRLKFEYDHTYSKGSWYAKSDVEWVEELR